MEAEDRGEKLNLEDEKEGGGAFLGGYEEERLCACRDCERDAAVGLVGDDLWRGEEVVVDVDVGGEDVGEGVADEGETEVAEL